MTPTFPHSHTIELGHYPWMNGLVSSTQWLPSLPTGLWVNEKSSSVFLRIQWSKRKTEDPRGDSDSKKWGRLLKSTTAGETRNFL